MLELVRTPLLTLTLALGTMFGMACVAPGPPPIPAGEAGSVTGEASAARPAASADGAQRPEVVFLGDSLTAGLGLELSLSFPALIQERIDRLGWPYRVVNAGVSGDTSAGGLRRLSWSLQGRPVVMVVALGGNDGLRGLPVEELKANLSAIVDGARQAGVEVILAGMEAPPNNGPEYAARFRRVYREVAEAYDVPLIPFLLDGVAGEPSMNQADGIHPNAEGARRVADTVWQALEPVLRASTSTR